MARVSTGAHLHQKKELNSTIFREGLQSLGAPRQTRATVPEAQCPQGLTHLTPLYTCMPGQVEGT